MKFKGQRFFLNSKQSPRMIFFIILVLFSSLSFSEDHHGSIPDIKNEEAKKLIQALDKEFSGKIVAEELPSQRSLMYIKREKIDFHYPVLLPLTNVKKKFDYIFSNVTVNKVVYAVYVNKKNTDIALHNLQNYIIEGESGHVDFFDFHVTPSNCVECSLKKLENSRIDGYIYPSVLGERLIKDLKLKNIDSYYFDTYETKFALPLNQKGKEMDLLLTKLFKSMIKNKTFVPSVPAAKNPWKPTRE
jgi:hypothetical protein